MAKVNWQLDKSHSGIGFSVRHMMISNVRGSFTDFDATVAADPANLADVTATIKINAASVDTKDEGRDGHLKSPDFFNVEQHPNITFTVTQVRSKGGEEYEITGDLTIAGVTKPVTLNGEISGPAKDPWGNEKIAVSAAGSLNRSEFGLTWNAALEAGGVLVSDTIKLNIELQFAKAA
ncbi:polyisoprenoid-binding protein [Cohnella pontilimi]|uniref:Polyisoprenoid-binding protein n=1 Tax=Cohnella pontilimi TaxID=2564100 RepID=A0A4U0FED4_9BACL|nr:YceI family protein [Cohnella pontilimi]TJY43303.1 polyisoprenoid-binding protein [Cohnella pontilimi]